MITRPSLLPCVGRRLMRRWLSSRPTDQCWTRLTGRRLIRVHGIDTVPFLQRLLTNDTRYFDQYKHDCMYALMLNNQGRVLYDIVLYNCSKEALIGDERNLLLECDAAVADELMQLLRRYQLRAAVNFVSCSDKLSVVAAFPRNPSSEAAPLDSANERVLQGSQTLHSWAEPIAHCIDPRVDALGTRMVVCDELAWLEHRFSGVAESDGDAYRRARYLLGVAEGAAELVPSKSLPLESNADYLNGVSFHKGCYVGQELTARTHHTGVVRKRLMPLELSELADVAIDAPVFVEAKPVGKVRAMCGRHGLALLRVAEALAAKQLHVLQERDNVATLIPCRTWKPSWWHQSDLVGEIRGFQPA